MKSAPRFCTALLLSGAWALVACSSLVAQNTSAAGGSGGTSFSQKCPDGMVIVALRGYAGQWLDQVNAVCQDPNMNTGSWDTAGGGGLGPFGESHIGNASVKAVCDNGYAVKEFKGGAGAYVNTITVTCYKLGSSARTGTDRKYAGLLGGSGGTPYGPFKCPDSKPAIGIFGRAGTYVDKFGLICGYVMPSTPVLISPAANADVTSKRPTFDWDNASFITKPYKICINLSSGASCSQSGTITGTINVGTTQWTPSSDLNYTRGDVVYWRVEACNDSGCTGKSASFRFMPN